MTGLKRTGTALLALVLAGGAGASLMAQIPGMPLFTNPRYATGLRIHGDIAQPTDQGTAPGDLTVLQAGATFALGPIGMGVNAGMLRNDIKNTQACQSNPSTCDTKTRVTASALAQLRVAGGGRAAHSLSVFGGASYDLTAYDTGQLTASQAAALGIDTTKALTIPVGVALGYHVSLGVASINLWGAPRMVFFKALNCGNACPSSDSQFRWAVGADIPVFRVLSVRAAYDSGTSNGVTTAFWGVGASIGLGGMR